MYVCMTCMYVVVVVVVVVVVLVVVVVVVVVVVGVVVVATVAVVINLGEGVPPLFFLRLRGAGWSPPLGLKLPTVLPRFRARFVNRQQMRDRLNTLLVIRCMSRCKKKSGGGGKLNNK